MTSDGVEIESRLARVEERVSGLTGRVNAVDRRLDEIMPILTEVATQGERVANIYAAVTQLRQDFVEHRKKLEKRDEDAVKDQRTFNRWAIGLGITIILALASVAAIVLTSHP